MIRTPVRADASPLLSVQSSCNAALEGPCDSLTALVAFALSTYVADLSRNLFVDTTYSPSLERARLELMVTSSRVLGLLADAVQTQNRIAAVDALGELIQFYTQLLGRLSDAEEARYGNG